MYSHLLSTLAARAFSNAYFGEHPRPNISRVLCYGNESKLLDCSYTSTTSCSHTNTAGVRCQGETIPGLMKYYFINNRQFT